MLTQCQKRFMINYAIASASPAVRVRSHVPARREHRRIPPSPEAEIDLCARWLCGIDQFTLKFPVKSYITNQIPTFSPDIFSS